MCLSRGPYHKQMPAKLFSCLLKPHSRYVLHPSKQTVPFLIMSSSSGSNGGGRRLQPPKHSRERFAQHLHRRCTHTEPTTAGSAGEEKPVRHAVPRGGPECHVPTRNRRTRPGPSRARRRGRGEQTHLPTAVTHGTDTHGTDTRHGHGSSPLSLTD